MGGTGSNALCNRPWFLVAVKVATMGRERAAELTESFGVRLVAEWEPGCLGDYCAVLDNQSTREGNGFNNSSRRAALAIRSAGPGLARRCLSTFRAVSCAPSYLLWSVQLSPPLEARVRGIMALGTPVSAEF